MTVFPNSDYNAKTIGSIVVTQGQETSTKVTVGFTGLPPGTKIQGFSETEIGGRSVPIVWWDTEAPIQTKGCVGGTVTAAVAGHNYFTGTPEERGPVTLGEKPLAPGEFEGNLPRMYPVHGVVTITIKVSGCAHPSEEGEKEFEIYIDPSGSVVDGYDHDAPVAGATVTLLASSRLDGPFSPVAGGSNVMSPANRTNPDTTTGEGMFGWDTLPGFYEVTASKLGCGSTTTHAFEVPPPVSDLRLVLHCSKRLKIETTSLSGATRGTPYESQLVAYGGSGTYKWKKGKKLPKGLKLEKSGLLKGTPSTKLAAGEYEIVATISDSSKPKQTATRTLLLDIS